MVHCTNRQKHSKPLVYQSSQVYQECTNSVPTVYQSSKTVRNSQKQSKDIQNSKNDHWCTNRHMSTKTVPTVYQSSKTVKTAQNVPNTRSRLRVPTVNKTCPSLLAFKNNNVARGSQGFVSQSSRNATHV